MNSTLFLSLVLAHIIGDFYLQTDECCKQKETRKFKSWFLYVHAIIIGLLSWIIVPSCNFGLWALLIAVSHFTIDAVKIHCPKGLWSFVIDQLLHLGILIAISNIYEPAKELPLRMIDCLGSFSIPLLILAILLCMKPDPYKVDIGKIPSWRIRVLQQHKERRSIDWKFGTNISHRICAAWAVRSNRIYCCC